MENENEAAPNPSKRPKTSKASDTLSDVLSPDILSQEEQLKDQYAAAKPFPNCVLSNLFRPDFVRALLKEFKDFKVNFKESDLFRVYQSIDLANLHDDDEIAQTMPHVMTLRHVLYSDAWRRWIERVAHLPSGTLSSQVDCALNCHAPGCHLLCHDDVIGTRKVSYILYLTEETPEWIQQDGGALELYDSHSAASEDEENKQQQQQQRRRRRIPDSIPCNTILPAFNSMAFFEVVPGVSFHAVQEVCGDQPRLSLQGWYHAEQAPDNLQDATLQRLTKRNQEQEQQKELDKGFVSYQEEKALPGDDKDDVKNDTTTTADNIQLSEADRTYLAQFVDETYLTPSGMKEMRSTFEDESSIQLRNFLNPTWMEMVQQATSKEDCSRLPVADPNYYQQGASDAWKLMGPSHMQRFLEYSVEKDDDGAKSSDSSSVGSVMLRLRQQLLESPAFGRYLHFITSLLPTKYRGQIRRFRPGLDYTVAHYGLLRPTSLLDATLCFVADDAEPSKDVEPTGGEHANLKQSDDAGEEEAAAAASDLAAWQSGDVGGFECYIAAHDEKDDDDEKKEAADEYNPDDDSELLSVPASNNTLSLVYRDPGTMRFVKYVGSRAPSSRWDIAMEYQVDGDGDGDEDDNGGGGDANEVNKE